MLKDKKIDATFVGQTTADGKLYNISSTKTERRPFKAYLDVGLVRTTTGNRVFGAMKGACDGGLNIPHNERRFPGCRMIKEEAAVGKKKGGAGGEEKVKPTMQFTASEHLEHIMGTHVQKYYDLLKGSNAQKFKKQFSKWEQALKGKKVEDLYKAAHAAIRSNPARVKVARKQAPVRKQIQAKPTLIQQNSKGSKWLRQKKIGSEMRHQRVQAKIAKISAEL